MKYQIIYSKNMNIKKNLIYIYILFIYNYKMLNNTDDSATLKLILEKLTSIENKLDTIESNNNSDTLGSISDSGTATGKKIVIKKKDSKPNIIKTGVIKITNHPNGCTVTGETFDKKSIIKSCKGWWTPSIKGWTVKQVNPAELKKKLKECTKTLNIEESDTELEIDNTSNINNITNTVQKNSKKETNSPVSYNEDELDFLDDSD